MSRIDVRGEVVRTARIVAKVPIPLCHKVKVSRDSGKVGKEGKGIRTGTL